MRKEEEAEWLVLMVNEGRMATATNYKKGWGAKGCVWRDWLPLPTNFRCSEGLQQWRRCVGCPPHTGTTDRKESLGNSPAAISPTGVAPGGHQPGTSCCHSSGPSTWWLSEKATLCSTIVSRFQVDLTHWRRCHFKVTVKLEPCGGNFTFLKISFGNHLFLPPIFLHSYYCHAIIQYTI